jgi:RND family efflux transporter MFP subunit
MELTMNATHDHNHVDRIVRAPAPSHDHNHHDLSAAAPRTPEQRKRAGRRAWLLLGVVGVAAGAAAAAGTLPRLGVTRELAETTGRIDQARRNVTVVSPAAASARAEVRLPGSTSPLQQAVLYARTSGYVAGFNADIGDRVKAGQLLATIASPEVDQQLLEARARLEEGRANLELAAMRLNRTKEMSKTGAATQQELDDAQAVYNTQRATQRVSEAVVSRLETDQSYQKVVAPFDGVVTRRNVDIGTLITAGSGAAVSSLFEIQQQSTMKVFVDVPQGWAASIIPGTSAAVELREFPGEHFEAKVVRTSGALDPATRTLRTELHLPNTDGRLIPGMYAQVKLSLGGANRPLVVPASTLVIDTAGVQVVTLGADNRVARTPVRLGRDFGREVEVVSGLKPDARLVVSPREDLHAGEEVTVLDAARPSR